MTLDRLIAALISSKNEAADDALLEALILGNSSERTMVLEALFRRRTTHGLTGLIGIFEELPGSLQNAVLKNVELLHHAIREAARSERSEMRLSAMKLIALGKQGKLAYVLSENLHNRDETYSKAAVEALVSLARWIATETRKLQKTEFVISDAPLALQDPDAVLPTIFLTGQEANRIEPTVYQELMEQRPEIEQAVARALDSHRGKHAADLMQAGLLLSDWPGSKTLAILHTAKHGGQSAMLRRMQQPPAAEAVEAFLLGASHGGLRSHFGIIFSHIEEAPVLDALLRRTHWLKDHALQTCMHLVTRGAWWSESELIRDISRRDCGDAARIGEWIALSGAQDVVQDERLERLKQHAQTHDPANFAARLQLLRIVCRRRNNNTGQFLKSFLNDTDERLVRMATREIIRRRPPEFESALMQRLSGAPESVRRIIGRAVGQSGFEQFWNRYAKLDRATRKQAGKAMLKLLPDSVPRLNRKLTSGPMDQRLQAMQMVQDLKLADQLLDSLLVLCADPSPRLRSRAVSLLSEVPTLAPEPLIERLLTDSDARVRANVIEVLETRHKAEFVPILIQRARSGSNRERANAIKVMHKLRMNVFGASLLAMLNDNRPEHRISAMWALKQTGWWNLIGEVGRMAKADPDLKVRRYALNVLKAASELIREQRAKAG